MTTGDSVVSEYHRRAEECRLQAKNANSEGDKARWLDLLSDGNTSPPTQSDGEGIDPPRSPPRKHSISASSPPRLHRQRHSISLSKRFLPLCDFGAQFRGSVLIYAKVHAGQGSKTILPPRPPASIRSCTSRAADRGKRSITIGRMAPSRSRSNNVAMSGFELLRVRQASRRDHVEHS